MSSDRPYQPAGDGGRKPLRTLLRPPPGEVDENLQDVAPSGTPAPAGSSVPSVPSTPAPTQWMPPRTHASGPGGTSGSSGDAASRTGAVPGLGVGSGAGQQHTAQPPALADGSRTEFVAPPEDSEGSSTEFVHGPEPHDATEYMAQPDWAESSSRTQITEAPPPEVVAELPRDAALRGHGPAGKVTVLSGSLNGASYALAAKVSLGRSPDCTITLPDGTVSAIHAVVIRWRRRSMLLDWDSKSGTTLNGQRVVRAFLKNGDRIGVGGVSLQFHAASDGRRLGVWVLSGLGVVSGLAYLARGFFGT